MRIQGAVLTPSIHPVHLVNPVKPSCSSCSSWLKTCQSALISRYCKRMNELVFEVIQEEDGGFCAECLSENIFTQGDSWAALRQNVQEAVRAFYFDQPPAPKIGIGFAT